VKVALLVAYDGTGFSGFARQPRARTVQGEIETRVSLILRADVKTTGAGRTDAGVHASGQVMSFEAPEGFPLDRLGQRMNKWIGPEVVVRAAVEVSDAFDARFSAKRREYEYRVYRTEVPDPFRERFAVWEPGPLSVSKMRAGARALIGEHDFSAFCRKGPGSLVRRVRAVRIVPAGDDLTFKIAADSFCHQQVRSMVGLLLDVGTGRRAPDDVVAALASKDRARAGRVAPAKGLHLVRVVYRPDPFAGRRRS